MSLCSCAPMAPRAPLPSSTPVAFCDSPLPPSTCSYVPRRRLPVWLPAADAILVKTCGTPRKFMSNSRKYFTPLSHVRPVFFLFPSFFLRRNGASSIKSFWKNDSSQMCRNNFLEERSIVRVLSRFDQLKS